MTYSFAARSFSKSARRRAAKVACLAMYIALAPIAILISPFIWFLEIGVYLIDRLEAIAGDD